MRHAMSECHKKDRVVPLRRKKKSVAKKRKSGWARIDGCVVERQMVRPQKSESRMNDVTSH
jgi:hypothetical protein